MRSLLNVDLRILPKKVFFFILLFYPFYSYLGHNIVERYTEIFVLICLCFMLFRIGEIYNTHSNFAIPLYVVFFGLFTAYTLICGIFMSDYFSERGIKYFYTDPIWITFIALIIVENTCFSNNSLKFAKRILWLTLILASLVSIIQISNPLFFFRDEVFVQGLSIDRMEEYYKNNPKEIMLSKGVSGKVHRFLHGYRHSIFSFINELSVGIDTIAIFSILISWRPISTINRGVVTLSAAIVSLLSSGRWIIVNFFVVASQMVWTGKNKLVNLIYFVLSSVVLLIMLALIANSMNFNINQYISERLMDNSASTRLLAFEVFFKVFPDNPILGTGGVDTEEMLRLLGGRSSQIHVGFLKLFYYYGLVGGLLYLSFMVTFLIRLRKMAQFSGYWGGFFAVLTFFIANLTLVELSLFYYGPLLAIIFANHFYFNKIREMSSLTIYDKVDYSISN